jgi:DNA-binding response OmpR family regulator
MPRILILESYGPTRQALAMILEREGWEVTLSQTEEETFEALVNSNYDVLLVDLEMNTGDGWRVLRQLMPDRATPIIAILDQESQRSQKAQDLGAGAILYKPLRRKRLLDSATAALNRGSKTPLCCRLPPGQGLCLPPRSD